MKSCDPQSGNAVAIISLPVFSCWSIVIGIIISKFLKCFFKAKLIHKHCIVSEGCPVIQEEGQVRLQGDQREKEPKELGQILSEVRKIGRQKT